MKIKVLKKIVNKHDPLGLLEIGAPEDEYTPEIESISKRLTEQMRTEEIEKVVFEEFAYWFGEETIRGSENSLKAIAKDIFKQSITTK